MSGFLAAMTGLAAGGAHVVTGPDHLAAVLPMATGSRRRGAAIGALWGLGHGLGVLVLGLLGRYLTDVIDIEAVSAVSEIVVGVMLVGLGVWSLRRSRTLVVHTHTHPHDHDPEHKHVHVHVGDKTVGQSEHIEHGAHRGHSHSVFGFGLLHGAAGAGHLFGVLPSLALPDGLALIYLGTYFFGAVVAMSVFALGVGMLTQRPDRLPRMLALSGVLSLGVGLVWVGNNLPL